MFVALDIGGSKTRVAVIINQGITKKEVFETVYDYELSLGKIKDCVQRLTDGGKIRGVYVSIAAICSKDGQEIISSFRLKDYVGKTFASDLSTYFHTKCYLINDASCSALGEAALGAGKDKKIVVYLTVSTGINGACVVNGELNKSSAGFQFGHQIISAGGKYWKYCGQKGCLEAYASGLAFEEKYGVKPEDCKDQKIWDEFAYYLSLGIVNIIVLYGPEILVIGGGLSNAGNYLFVPLRRHVEDQLKVFPMPAIVPSNFKDESGLMGALTFLIKNNS